MKTPKQRILEQLDRIKEIAVEAHEHEICGRETHFSLSLQRMARAIDNIRFHKDEQKKIHPYTP